VGALFVEVSDELVEHLPHLWQQLMCSGGVALADWRQAPGQQWACTYEDSTKSEMQQTLTRGDKPRTARRGSAPTSISLCATSGPGAASAEGFDRPKPKREDGALRAGGALPLSGAGSATAAPEATAAEAVEAADMGSKGPMLPAGRSPSTRHTDPAATAREASPSGGTCAAAIAAKAAMVVNGC